jgi:hypothetical protein
MSDSEESGKVSLAEALEIGLLQKDASLRMPTATDIQNRIKNEIRHVREL